MELTALDVRYAVRELNGLVGAKIQKVYQSDTDKRDVLCTLFVPGHDGKLQLRFLLPGILCTLEGKPDHYPQLPPGFAMFLRKYLIGSRITGVTQQGFDRIIRFAIDSKSGPWTLVAELIPPGNLVLVGEDGKIKNLLENQNYKDRTLRGGIAYEAPPAAYDLTTQSDEEVAQRITHALRANVAAALATALGLGGAYAEEACARAGVDRSSTALTPEQLQQLISAVRALFNQPIVAHKDEQRVYPFLLESRACEPCTRPEFLAAIGASLGAIAASDTRAAAAIQAKPKRSKAQAMLEAQERSLTALQETAAQETRIAERIYEEYALVKEIIDAAQAARAADTDVAHALKRFPQIKRYDTATAIVELELEDPA